MIDHKFLSTSPLRGTTKSGSYAEIYRNISIHVPLAGDDPSDSNVAGIAEYFYPRPPCGGRHTARASLSDANKFLSTSPLRGTTG